MPRVAKGVHSTYPVENMIAAVEAVREGASIREASSKFGVPRSTLGDRMTGRIAVEARPGHSPIIPIEIENRMVEKAVSCANQGFGVSKKTLTARAGSLCRSLGLNNKFTRGIPGKAWWKGFRARHPEVTLRKPEKLSTVRSKAINAPVVGSYFITLYELIKTPNIAPSCVWNMDETSLSLEHTPTNVVAKRGSRVIPGRTANSKETITVLPCVNAAGGKMPPLIIVKGKTSHSLRAFNTHEGPEGAFWTYQAKAYMDDDMGTVWFRDVFLPNCGDIRPQFLLMDNHHSHETLGLLEIASENEIHVLAFPPNSTHYLCPLDRAVFGPFQREYNTVCTEFMAASAGAIVNKLTFPKLVNQAYIKTFSRTNIVSGFEATGIYQWNPLAIPATAFSPAEQFDKASSESKIGEHPLQWVTRKVMVASAHPSTEDDTALIAPSTSNDTVTLNTSIIDQDGNVVGEVTIGELAEEAPSIEPFIPPNAKQASSESTAASIEPLSTNMSSIQSVDPTSHHITESDPIMPNMMTEHDAANILLTLNESSEQMEVEEWSDVWNVELESLFKIQPIETPNSQPQEKKTKRVTTHRVLTSPEIIKQKQDDELQKERKEKEKEERKRKREENKRIKEAKKSNLKPKPIKKKQINEDA